MSEFGGGALRQLFLMLCESLFLVCILARAFLFEDFSIGCTEKRTGEFRTRAYYAMNLTFGLGNGAGERVQHLQTRLFPICTLQEKGMEDRSISLKCALIFTFIASATHAIMEISSISALFYLVKLLDILVVFF